MNFTSTIFLIFLPIVVIFYWIIPEKFRYIWLLLCSYFFYGYQNLLLLPLFFSTTLVSYLCAIGISNTQSKKMHRFFLSISCVFMLGVLFIFKYLDFTIYNIEMLAKIFYHDISFIRFNLVLPVGISFYTFQTMSYVIDVYRGDFKAEKHFGYYALFVSFFPQLVAGPIENPRDLLPQLRKNHHLDSDCFSDGFYYLISGFIKKIVIADFLGLFVTTAYSNVSEYSGLMLFVATIFFAIQIYGDFSGYSDIALGVSALMGIRLSKNFSTPYKSKSVSEFYRRWHISLNKWFTQYLYIPLGGSKKGFIRKLINIMIVFFLSGLWHGAKWTYVIWGLYSGVIICLENIFLPYLNRFKSKNVKREKLISIISVFFTFIILCFGWIFFRSDSITDAAIIYNRIFTSFLNGIGYDSFKDIHFVIRVIVSISLFLLISHLPKIDFKIKDEQFYKITRTSMLYVSLTILIVFCYIYQLSTTGESGFIYFQF